MKGYLTLICCSVFLILLSSKVFCSSDVSDDAESADDQENEIFISERAAKAVAKKPRRVKRGFRFRVRFRVKRLWGEERNEERESRNEAARRAAHNDFCRKNCKWSAWTSWTGCSARCGNGGIRTRTHTRQYPGNCGAWASANGCTGTATETDNKCAQPCQNGGIAANKFCLCTLQFKGTCCELRKQCQHPGKPAHGSVTPDSAPNNYGTIARYSCQTGYRLQGAATRKCEANEQWAGTVPSCQLVNCGDPGTPSSGSRSMTATTYQSTVTYSCNTGYRISGGVVRTCQANGQWSGSLPSCPIISCGATPPLPNGIVKHCHGPPGNVYNTQLHFICNQGYYLQGTEKRKCQLSGQWDGTAASCHAITCPDLTPPASGAVSLAQGKTFGKKATYSCSTGHRLQGSVTRTCTARGNQGIWSGSAPTCPPVNCGDPGTPSNGVKNGNSYTYTSAVTYQCVPGHYMTGQERITCNANGQWSAGKPTCTACPRNQYKPGVNARTSCLPCPVNSHTQGTGSVDQKNCLCNTGFRGPAGGPCGEVTCPPLPAPANGKVTACQVSINDVCSFDCDNGYILSPSNQQRKCQPDGSWTGSDVTCLPCGQNTYKAGPGQCTRCPADTHTTGTARMLDGCICNDGFTGPGGGPCQDVNECSRHNGGCEQSCENTRGGFQCKCSIPGYKVNPADRKRCIVEKRCSSFTTPTNGGIVCHHKNDTNTDRCQVKCNDGFEHPVRSNQFEECGPATNFQWSYEINNIPIPACVEQYFPGVIVDAEIAYFVASCDQLTDQQKQDAMNAFLQLLRGQGVCLENGRAVCNVTDLWIECGEIDLSGGIQKRDASSSRVLKFKFKLTTDQKPVRTMNCGRFCDGQAVCDACFTNHVQSTVRKVTAEQEKLREVFGTQAAPDARPNPQPRPGVSTTSGAGVAPKSFNRGITAFRSNLARNFNRVIPSTSGQSPVRPTEAVTTAAPPRGMMNIGGLVLMPAPTGLQMMSDVKMACETGMEKKRDMCVPCTPGSNLPPGSSRCEQCIAGMYQPEAQKTSCIPCPAGKTSPRGAIGCA